MDKEQLKYYYVSNGKSVGPFFYKEFIRLQLSEDTLIWYTGAKEWRPQREIDFLHSSNVAAVEQTSTRREDTIRFKWSKKRLCVVGVIGVLIVAIFGTVRRCPTDASMRRVLAENAYESQELYPYLEKFYRDVEFFGINKRKSMSVSIKMAPMQYFENTKDYHGVSFGYQNDDIIEIYINEDSWKHFNRAQKYALMYHELAHDILNVDDLPNTPENYNKLMAPVLSRFDHLTMDQFIDMSHELFYEISD